MDSAERRNAPVLKLPGSERLLGTRSVAEPADEVERFESFVATARERIELLQKPDIPPKQLAREVLAIQRQLIREGSDLSAHSDAIEALFNRLWAEPPIQRLFIDLYNKACAILHSSQFPADGFGREAVAADLERILSWYVRRKSSLLTIAPDDQDQDMLWGLQVIHDRSFLGVPGFEVACHAALRGHRHEELWFKVFVRSGREYIGIRSGWDHWVDETETLLRLVPQPTDGAEEIQRFAAISPILPSGERRLIDDLRCFVPYAALNLPPGRHDIEVEAGIFEANGRRILFSSLPERVSLSESTHAVPSPQSFALWPVDLASGDIIERIRIRRGHREGNREVLTITSSFELWGHREQTLQLHYKVLFLNGDPVESGLSTMIDADGTFLHSTELPVHADVARFYDRITEIPLQALSLDEGDHELLLQLCISDDSGRALCGMHERFSLHIDADAVAPNADPEDRVEVLDAPDLLTDLQMGGFVVDPDSHFNGDSFIKIGVTLVASEWRSKVCRVVLSIEQDPLTTPSTKLRLRPQRQTRCCGGFDGPQRREIIAQFSSRDIASYLLLPPEGVKLLARAQVYTLDDCLIFNRTRPFVLREHDVHEAAQVVAFAEHPAAKIVDIVTHPVVGSSQIRSEVALDVRLDEVNASRFSLYHEVLDHSGIPIRQHPDVQFDALPGSVVGLDFSEEHFSCRYRAGVFQVRVELLNNLIPHGQQQSARPGGYTLKLLLFSEEGRLIHIVHQPLLVRGKNLPASPLAISYDRDRGLVVDPAGADGSAPFLEVLTGKVRSWLRSLGTD